MKKGLLVLSVLSPLIVVQLYASAKAQSPPIPDITTGGDAIQGKAQRHVDDDTPDGAAEVRTPEHYTPDGPPKQYYTVPELQWDPQTQSRCLNIVQREAGPEFRGGEIEAQVFSLVTGYPVCPGSQPAPARPSPAAAAHMVWRDQVKLPKPEPYIAPGKAITGLEAFLEIGGSRSKAESFSVFGYPLTITATGQSYDIDWGDGQWTRGVTSTGGPWPTGNVRHVYTVAGTYTVRVLQSWSGSWSVAGGPSGNVEGTLRTEGRIERFPVEQLQAVRNR